MKRDMALKDTVIVLLFTFLSSSMLIYFDTFELIMVYSREHEEYEIDELILILMILSISLFWYALRRNKEVKQYQKQLTQYNEELEAKVKKSIKEVREKDNQLYRSMKMASLGEMIENIAHQWRQPLSVISTSASGLKMRSTLNNLSAEQLENSLDSIVSSTKYLSNTIDDFSNYIKQENKQLETFNIKEPIGICLEILKGRLKAKQVEVLFLTDKNVYIESYTNELMQVVMNIINNAIDVLSEAIEEKKYIFINFIEEKDCISLSIYDNGNGINDDILFKIFEPYFTTKHKSKGTGLGMYMSHRILTESLHSDITVQNKSFEFNSKHYIGAEFIITIPKKFPIKS